MVALDNLVSLITSVSFINSMMHLVIFCHIKGIKEFLTHRLKKSINHRIDMDTHKKKQSKVVTTKPRRISDMGNMGNMGNMSIDTSRYSSSAIVDMA